VYYIKKYHHAVHQIKSLKKSKPSGKAIEEKLQKRKSNGKRKPSEGLNKKKSERRIKKGV
jgi:hypothetical protein